MESCLWLVEGIKDSCWVVTLACEVKLSIPLYITQFVRVILAVILIVLYLIVFIDCFMSDCSIFLRSKISCLGSSQLYSEPLNHSLLVISWLTGVYLVDKLEGLRLPGINFQSNIFEFKRISFKWFMTNTRNWWFVFWIYFRTIYESSQKFILLNLIP